MTPARPRLAACRLALLAGLALAAPARAHDTPFSYVDLRLAPGEATGTVMAHVFDLANAVFVTPPDSLLSPAIAASRHDAMVGELQRRMTLVLDGDTLRPEFLPGSEAVIDRRLLRFRFRAPVVRPPTTIEASALLFPEDPEHETYLNVFEGERALAQEVLDRNRRRITAWSGSPAGAFAVVRAYALQGIHHILIGPDHILFVIGLLLPGGALTRLLRIVTAFTLAHSVTLALAALGVVNPPARIVEPLIALSIVWIGIENLRRVVKRGSAAAGPGANPASRGDRRAAIAFGFGLVHGFGFAGVLAEFGLPKSAMGWSLVGFNLGVELGQAAIVLVVAPALALLARRWPRRAVATLRWGSVGVIAAGAWWLVERIRDSA